MTTAWDDLVAAAVQGTDRRPGQPLAWLDDLGLDAATLAGDPPGRVLAAAALATAARRAGAHTPSVDAQPSLAPPETAAVAPALVPWLAALDTPDTSDLLADFLSGAVRRGLVLPGYAAPDLLDLATRPGPGGAALRADAFAASGERGRWLAAENPRWQGLLPTAPANAWLPSDPPRDPNPTAEAWTHGTPAERLAWLRDTLVTDPPRGLASARSALTGRGEIADFRTKVVTLLATIDHPDIEPLLDDALDDRATGVRAAAGAALAGREHTAYGQRMATRARAWVRAERTLLGRPRLVVEVPAALDPEATRDGVGTVGLPAGAMPAGPATRALASVVSTAPLATWAELGTPVRILALDVPDEWGDLLRRAWAHRAEVEGDGVWADALLTAHPLDDGLLGLVDLASPEVLTTVAMERLARIRSAPEAARVWLLRLPHPWPPEVRRAFVRVLPEVARGQHAGVWSPVLEGLARSEPLALADHLRAVVEDLPLPWRLQVERALERLGLRSRMETALRDIAATAHASVEPVPPTLEENP